MSSFPVNRQDYLEIGGLWLPKTGLIQLIACRNNAGNNATFRRSNDTAGNGYAPSAITYVPSVIVIRSNTAEATTVGHGIGYADADVGFRSSTAFTNAIFIGGGSAANDLGFAGANGERIIPIFGWSFPASKFPMYTSGMNGDSTAMMYGYQV